MGLNETDEKVVKKRTLGAFYSVLVEKLYGGLVRNVLEMYAEPLMLGNLFAMESLKDISQWKMMESLNIDNMVKFFFARKRYRAQKYPLSIGD